MPKKTWNPVNLSLIADDIAIADNQTVYMYDKFFKRFYRSKNTGETWDKMADLPSPAGAGAASEYSLAFADANNGFLGISDKQNNKSWFYKTTNAGNSWTEIHSEDFASVPFYVKNQKEIILHFADGNFKTMDDMGNVNATPLGKTDKFLTMFSAAGTTRYAIAQDSTGKNFVYTTAYAAGIHDKNNAPAALENLEIYPNPCTGNTLKIDYTSTQKGNTTICITDISGKTIYIQELGNKPAGNYGTTAQLSHLPKGIYILEVKSDSGSQRKKLLMQ